MQFREGTTVYTATDEKIGDIERFVIDPRAEKIAGLVVRKGFFFTQDRVIPVNDVQEANADRVILKPSVRGEDEFPPFEETHYVEPGRTEMREMFNGDLRRPIYYFPPLGVANWGSAVYDTPAIPVSERNIPEGTVAVKENASVITRDGEHVGDVERIIAAPNTDHISHIAVTQGLLFEEEHLLPAAWIQNAREGKVHLVVSAETLKNLGKL